MNYSVIKIVEFPQVFIEIIAEILECIISSFLSKNWDKIKPVRSLLKLLSSKHKWNKFLGRHIPFFTLMGKKLFQEVKNLSLIYIFYFSCSCYVSW